MVAIYVLYHSVIFVKVICVDKRFPLSSYSVLNDHYSDDHLITVHVVGEIVVK